MSVKIPYVNTVYMDKPDNTFLDLLRNRVCPHFSFVSLSTLLLGICLVIFIGSRIAYPPGGYQQFLQHPTQLDPFVLQIQKFRSDKKYIYQLFTAMFMHYSYRHIIMNVIFGIFIMYELQHCWIWSIVIALVAGVAANCMAVVSMEGHAMGFSGVLCACIGIQLAALLIHCNYLRQTFGSTFYIIFFMTIITLFMIIGFTNSGLIHFFGVAFGLLFGLALYPRMPEASTNSNLDKIFKVLSVAFLALAVLFAFIA